MTEAKRISKKHFNRIAEIVANTNNEFPDVCAQMGAIHGRAVVFMGEIDKLRCSELIIRGEVQR